MKKLSFLIALLLLAGRLHCSSQTVNATYNFADFTGSPQSVKRVQITPIQPIGLVGTNIVFPTTITRQTSTAGALTVSNLYNGFSYRVILQDANGGSIGQLTNWFGTNVTGNVNASAYTVISTNLYYGAIAYSQAASDARFSLILSPGTNITFTTNGALVKINASAPAAATVTNFASITVTNFADIQGTLFNSTGTLNINQTGNSIDGAGINIQSGGGDNAGPNSSGGTVSIATGTSYGAQNSAADLSIQAGNGSGNSSDPTVYGRGSDVNIAAGTGSGGYRDGKINLNGTVTVTNSATMLSNVFIANNLYVTNHAYDVSTSRLDPLANEFVTAEYVQSVMAANFDLYFSTNSSGVSITNVGTPSTMVLVNPTTSQTNTISSFTNGTYFTARLQTNSISYIQSVPINLYTYVQITGGGSITAHPEMWLYNTNGTSVKLGYSSDNTYSSDIAVPVNLAIALTNTPYLNVNLTNSPQLLLRWYVTSTTGNPTWRFLIGNGNVSHITVGTVPSANQNYVGTFTGNGTGLTNIPSTGITGLGTAAYSNSTAFAASSVTNLTAGQIVTIAAAVTNNASPTLTGLAVGAQTALDVNGNGKVGGVTQTNGLLTATSLTTPTLTVSTNLSISGNLTASSITFTNLAGDGSGLTNIPISAISSKSKFYPVQQVLSGYNTYGGLPANTSWQAIPNASQGGYLHCLQVATNGTYISVPWRIDPDDYTPYKNLVISFIIVATNTFSIAYQHQTFVGYDLTTGTNIDLSKDLPTTFNSGLNLVNFTNVLTTAMTNAQLNVEIGNASYRYTSPIWILGIRLYAY